MLTSLTVKDFRCLKDVSVPLTPLHVFIGPNDSGKSTILRAAHLIGEVASASTNGAWPFDRVRALFRFEERPTLQADVVDGRSLVMRHTGTGYEARVRPGGAVVAEFTQNGTSGARATGPDREVCAAIGPATFVRLNASALREPSELIPEGAEIAFQDTGAGLAGVYEAILSRGDQSFHEIAARVRTLFPTIKRLWVPTTPEKKKELAIELHDGVEVRSADMSEGLLYYLAFEALACIQRPAVILVEEPENGLHPARIAEVMKLLRGIAEDKTRPAQVLIATHSPLVVNEARPEEVTVVTRDVERGTQCTRMKDTPHFEERQKVYALGELWLSYADGRDETPLLRGLS
ncbi:MAG: AAA family ATPase [Myxococcota bacterium]